MSNDLRSQAAAKNRKIEASAGVWSRLGQLAQTVTTLAWEDEGCKYRAIESDAVWFRSLA